MAPLSPEWSWRQTETTLTIDIKAKGVVKRKCDIFLSDQFLKVNASPYLLALDLTGEIEEERSTATISQGRITIQMFKAVKGVWEDFAVNIKDRSQRDEVLERRKESIERAQRKVEERRKEREALRQREEREAQDRSFELDKRKRQAIEDAKERELESAREEIASFTTKSAAATEKQPPLKSKTVTFADSDSESDQEEEGEGSPEQSAEEDEEDEEEESDEDVVILPPPRETMPSVPIEFTPTIVENLPAREGREEELKLIRRSQARRAAADDDDTDLTERHPVFLKDKGDKMCKHGNFRGALRAYSRALEIDPAHTLSLCNRSLCYLRLGDAEKAEEDCRSAVGMLAEHAEEEESPSTSSSSSAAAQLNEDLHKKKLLRIKMLGRLAKALAAQGRTKEVIEELENASKLARSEPDLHASIQRDLEDARACEKVSFAGDFSGAETLAELKTKIESGKDIADSRIKQNDPFGALKVYSQIIDFITEVEGQLGRETTSEASVLDREFLSEKKLACLSNRASGHLMKGDFVSSIEDCKAAIGIIAELFDLYNEDGGSSSQKQQAQVDDRGEDDEMDALIALAGDLLLRSSQTNANEFEEKKLGKISMSLVRILRRMSSAFSHLKDYETGVKVLRIGLDASNMLRNQQLTTEIRRDINVLDQKLAQISLS